MENTNLLCFCLPTCNPNDMFTHLLPSLKNIGRLKDYCSFGIIFQPPYTEEQIKEVINEFNKLNLTFNYEYKEYEFEKGKTPLNKMRQDSSLKYPNALFYGILDDDMEFQEGIDLEYLDILYLMLKYRKFSVASINPSQSSPDFTYEPFEIKIADLNKVTFYTKAGLIVRGGSYYNFEGLLPEDMINLVGGRQDISTCLYRIIKGESAIECSNGKCLHYEYRETPGYDEYDWLDYDSDEIITNTNWLEKNNYIRHLPILSSDKKLNFLDVNYQELLQKGCTSFELLPINLLTYDSYLIDNICDLINDIIEKESTDNYPLFMNNSYSINIAEENQEVQLYSVNYPLIASYSNENSNYCLINTVYKSPEQHWLAVYKLTENIPIRMADVVLLTDGSFYSSIHNSDLKNYLDNISDWEIVWNLINYGKQYLNKFIIDDLEEYEEED